MRQSGLHNRADLVFRKLDQPEKEVENDPRLDAIAEKVIALMYDTDPEVWTTPQWQLFKMLWQDRLKQAKRKAAEPTEAELISATNSAELKALLHGSRSKPKI